MSNDILGSLVRALVTVPEDRLGPVKDFARKLAGSDGEEWVKNGKLFLRKEPCWTIHTVSSSLKPVEWIIDDEGNIHFTLISNGLTREQWEWHLKRCGCQIGDYARQVLCRASEAPTNGVIYNIMVLPGKKISTSDRITKNIRVAAEKYGGVKPHWEVACLIRDTFTDEQLKAMGLWYIVTMHEPINNSEGDPYLLNSSRYDGCRLAAGIGRPGGYWVHGGGFAFAVP